MATRLERVLVENNYAPGDFSVKPPDAVAAQHALLCEFAAALPELPMRPRAEFRVHTSPPRIVISQRSETSLLVEKLMRHVNANWAQQLAESGGGLFRAEGALSVRAPADCYAWLSSPLRRAIDLANQRALLAMLGYVPPLVLEWKKLQQEFSGWQMKARQEQDMVERYWILRALLELPPQTPLSGVRREKSKVRLHDYPLSGSLVIKPGAKMPPADEEVQVCLHEIDLFSQRVQFELL